ncbi:MAG: hypothetical protein ACXWE9_12125 [Methylobacter sp.]
MALLTTPGESEERRKQAATGPPFFWILFFGGAKKSISPSGAKNPIQITVALATHSIYILRVIFLIDDQMLKTVFEISN